MSRRRFGAVRRLPSRRWQARYRAASGRMVSAGRTFGTKAEADRFLARVELDMVGGSWVDPRAGRVTVAEWAERWMASATHLKPKTRASYGSLVRSVIVPTIGAARLGDLRPMRVREWVAELTARYSASRVRQAYRLLSQMVGAAQVEGLIAASPCVGVRLPCIAEHEPSVLTPAQVEALCGAMEPPYDLFVRTLAFTGLRYGEAAGLQRRYLDVEAQTLVVAASLSDADGVMTLQEPKTHQHRVVSLPDFLTDELREHLAATDGGDDHLVFTSPEGFAIRHPNFMRRVWYPACALAGIEATPHDLRATHATWLYDMGWSPVEIGGRLGHASATVTTKHYARRVAGRDIEIAAGLEAMHTGRAPATGTGVARGRRPGPREAAK